jgi:hypothetical protein
MIQCIGRRFEYEKLIVPKRSLVLMSNIYELDSEYYGLLTYRFVNSRQHFGESGCCCFGGRRNPRQQDAVKPLTAVL